MKRVALLIQGGYVSGYTNTVIKKYLLKFPHFNIYLSTWEDDYVKFKNEIDDFKKNNINVILSSKPKFSGMSNINYQITSTYYGLQVIKKDKFDLIIKCRSDFFYTFNEDFLTPCFDSDKIVAYYPGCLLKNIFIVTDYLFISNNVEKLLKLFNIDMLQKKENERYIEQKNERTLCCHF